MLLAAAALGPLLVVVSAARMLRRPDRPVALFVIALVLTSVLSLLLAGFATFGPDGGGLVLACLLALLCAASAAVMAIVASVRRRA